MLYPGNYSTHSNNFFSFKLKYSYSQHYVNFCWTAKYAYIYMQLCIYIYIYTHTLFKISFPLWFIIGCWYSSLCYNGRTLLFIHLYMTQMSLEISGTLYTAPSMCQCGRSSWLSTCYLFLPSSLLAKCQRPSWDVN